jgi:hypothetical protein
LPRLLIGFGIRAIHVNYIITVFEEVYLNGITLILRVGHRALLLMDAVQRATAG